MGWESVNLRSHNPHSNFAESAELEWGTVSPVILQAYEQNAYRTFTGCVDHVLNGADFWIGTDRSARLDPSVCRWLQQGRYEDGGCGLCGLNIHTRLISAARVAWLRGLSEVVERL